jgi:hypothetical protein
MRWFGSTSKSTIEGFDGVLLDVDAQREQRFQRAGAAAEFAAPHQRHESRADPVQRGVERNGFDRQTQAGADRAARNPEQRAAEFTAAHGARPP